MNKIMNLSNTSPLKSTKCLICQKKDGSSLIRFTENSWSKVYAAAHLRADQVGQPINKLFINNYYGAAHILVSVTFKYVLL